MARKSLQNARFWVGNGFSKAWEGVSVAEVGFQRLGSGVLWRKVASNWLGVGFRGGSRLPKGWARVSAVEVGFEGVGKGIPWWKVVSEVLNRSGEIGDGFPDPVSHRAAGRDPRFFDSFHK